MEFELKLTNGSWNDKLSDSKSAAYLKLKKNLEEQFNQVFCDEPDATVSQLNNSCRTQVTGFSEGSINVFFLLIRIELKQLFRGVAQLLVGFIYTFWFFHSFTSFFTLFSTHGKILVYWDYVLFTKRTEQRNLL